MNDETTTQPTCPACAAPVHDDWRFCQECGAERPGLYAQTDQPDEPELTDGPPGGALVRWRPVDAGIVFGVALLVTFLVASVTASALGTPLTGAELDTVTIVSLFANQLALIGGVALMVRRAAGSIRPALAIGPLTRRHVGIGVVTGLVGVAVSALVAALVTAIAEQIQGEPPVRPEQIPLERDPTGLILVILAFSTVLIAPFAEEMFFRGMLHQSIRRRWRFLPALFTSSALFAVAHLIPLVIPSIFALALLLTTMFERERSLWVPIVAHATFNVVGFTAAFLVESGAS